MAGPRGDPMSIFSDTRWSDAAVQWHGQREPQPVDRVGSTHIGDARQITFGHRVTRSRTRPSLLTGARVAFVSTTTGNSDVRYRMSTGAICDSSPMMPRPTRGRCGRRTASGSPYTSLSWDTSGDAAHSRRRKGTAEKLFDGFLRGDWQPQLAGQGDMDRHVGRPGRGSLPRTWSAARWSGRRRLQLTSLSLPMFSPDGRRFSLPSQAGRDREHDRHLRHDLGCAAGDD